MRYDRYVTGTMLLGYAACVFIALIILSLASGCSATDRVTDRDRCKIERTIVDAVGIGISASDELVGDRGGEEYSRASQIAHGVHGAGDVAVAACESLRDGNGWETWLMKAAQVILSIIGIIEGASADIEELAPIELRRAQAMVDWALGLP